MKISTKGRYGLRMLLDIAEHKDAGLVQIKDLAERQDISVKYAEQIISILNKARLVRSVRGAQGGYELIGKAEDYTIAYIIKEIEGDWAPVECVNDETVCNKCSSCASRSLWCGLNKVITEYLESITLQDLVDKDTEILNSYNI